MYNHQKIDKKWNQFWKENKTFKTNLLSNKPKYYVLDMFPYPSGSGLHVGHLEGYTATDIIARYKRMQGFEVLHPIGWDAFGLPAEQYALTTNNSPSKFTEQNIKNFRKQLQSVGFSFDYDKEVNTTDPNYYKITQWIFIQLYNRNLAEYREIEVNWCEQLGTTLANEEVLIKNGIMVSERGEYPVVKKQMMQLVLKITHYAKRLVDDLNLVNWPESIKNLQTNWIGKSLGFEIDFQIKDSDKKITVFTTKPETIFGVSFLVLAPEHILTLKLASKEQKDEVQTYVEKQKSISEITKKQEIEKEKSGLFIGSYAIHPITKKELPIYVSNYVFVNYGTGAIMAVPSGDERDIQFAKTFNLKYLNIYNKDKTELINSQFINGKVNDGIKLISNYLIKNKIGKKVIKYKLHDWVFSRQRYWGEPFPLIHLENKEIIVDNNLPVLLPKLIDFKPTKDGNSPLSKATKWVNVKINNQNGKRETNTMPQWAGSSWYYIGYLLKNDDNSYKDINSKEAKQIIDNWLPVDLYVGGQEHAVLHLMYARFWHKVLYDQNIVSSKEPFYQLFNQGMILGENSIKMSKSRGNVINPDDLIKQYGADALRVYEMFIGALNDDKNWSSELLFSIRKWLERTYRLFIENNDKFINDSKCLEKEINLLIKNVTINIEELKFNVAISEMMIFVNSCYKEKTIHKQYMLEFLKIFSVFAPHLGEELWANFGNTKTISYEKWPNYDDKKISSNTIIYPIQINGKLRSKIEVDISLSKNNIIKLAKANQLIAKYLNNKQIVKEIFIEKKLINFVIK